MLKRKFHTTLLYRPDEKDPITVKDPSVPSSYRAFRILSLFVRAYLQAKFGRGRGNPREKGIIWRHFFEEMGGLWVKIGQLIALRVDLFDKEFVKELSSLHHRVSGFPFSYAREKIRRSIGGSLEQVFHSFDEAPIAAASMAQVYMARLGYNGQDVVVKVLRPYARELLEMDMKIFRKAFRFLSHFNWFHNLFLDDMLWELEAILKEEADFRFEIKNIKEAKKRFKPYNIYVPKVYKRYSSEEVIVMEYVHGVAMAEFIKAKREDPERLEKWIQQNKIKPKKLGENLLRSIWGQVFESNYFHGDLQPGNILLLRKNRLAFIDLGSIGCTDAESLLYIRHYLISIGKNEYKKAAYFSMLLAPFIPADHRTKIQKNIIRALRTHLMKASLTDVDIEDRTTLTHVSEGVQKAFARHNIPPNWSLLKINRVFLTADVSILNLYPKVNMVKEWGQYYQELNNKGVLTYLYRAAKLMETASNTLSVQSKIMARNGMELKDKAKKGIQIVLFFFRFLQLLLWGGLFLFLWAYLYHHYDVIDYLHENYDNGFFKLVESLPALTDVYWLVIMVFTLFLIMRFYQFTNKVGESEYRY